MSAEAVVFLVDDDPGVRDGLSAVLESAGLRVAAFDSAETFAAHYTGGEVGCLLLDLRLGGMSGLQLLQRLRDSASPMPVIMITGHGDVPAAVEAMKLGAEDFLQKPLDTQTLLVRVHAALDKARSLRSSYDQAACAKARLAALTPREREMLQMLIAGKSSKQIAATTGLSLRTVNNHRTHLLAKTQAENTADLVRLAVCAGMSTDRHEH